MNRSRPDADVEGRPELAVRDEDREAIVEVFAEALIEALESRPLGTAP